MPPMQPTARIVVVETVYHQLTGGQPTSAESRYVRQLMTSEQPYIRDLTLVTEWVPLDHGWLSQASLSLLKNTGQTNIELWFGDGRPDAAHVILPPGESCRVQIVDLTKVQIRSASDNGRATIIHYPL